MESYRTKNNFLTEIMSELFRVRTESYNLGAQTDVATVLSNMQMHGTNYFRSLQEKTVYVSY